MSLRRKSHAEAVAAGTSLSLATVDGLPEPPPEMEITRIDIIVRLKPDRA